MGRLNLLQELKDGPSYTHAVLCTYEFDIRFFEQYALEHMRSLFACETITVVLDARRYAELCDTAADGYVPKYVNRVYLLHDLAVPGSFHPKLFLFISEKAGKLVVGSANLTKAGLTSNAELVSVFHHDASRDGTPSGVFLDAYAFLQKLAQESPTSTFASTVGEIARTAPWLEGPAEAPTGLVHSLEEPLLDQLERLVDGAEVDEFLTLSPFFDPDLEALQAVHERLRPKVVTIVTQDHETTLPTPVLADWIKRHDGVDVRVKLAEAPDQDGRRSFHAKLHVVKCAGRRICLHGSPNFTRAGLLSTARTGNIETGLLLQTTDAKSIDALMAEPFVHLRSEPSLAEISVRAPVDEPTPQPHAIRLCEISYEESLQALALRFESALDQISHDLALELTASSGELRCMLVLPDQSADFVAVTPEAEHLLESDAVRARLVCSGPNGSTPVSNWRWVENIGVGGRSPRVSRMLRDALDNPDGFDAAIAWLMERDDVQSLIYLLGVCDIPVRGLVRPSYVRIRDPFEGIPDPGPRLRGACADLREALSGFVWRHCRRLWRHLEQPTPEGAASFVHIARTVLRAIGYALRYEFGLVHGRREMSPEDWGALRDSATMFVEDLEGLLKMVAEYRWAAGAIGVPALSELLEELPAMRHQLLDETWQHVSSIRAACRVRAENGSLIQPAFFPRDTFSDENWRRLCKSCDTAIAAAMRGPLDDVNDG